MQNGMIQMENLDYTDGQQRFVCLDVGKMKDPEGVFSARLADTFDQMSYFLSLASNVEIDDLLLTLDTVMEKAKSRCNH